jgi:Predicted DNA-binding proteins
VPRPVKWRKVCAAPRCTHFAPSFDADDGVIGMLVDEYECIRLIDLEGLTQEQCADQMEISRATVQAIYQSARKKLADCVVNGRKLVIGGGEYRVCEHGGSHCGRGCCHRNQVAAVAKHITSD